MRRRLGLALLRAGTAGAALASRAVKDDIVGTHALGDGDGAEARAASTGGAFAGDLVDAVVGWVDLAWKTVAPATVALDLDAILGFLVFEGGGGLEVDGVPAEGDEGIAVGDLVASTNIRGPVAHRLVLGAPHARVFASNPRWVDVVAGRSALSKDSV